MSTIRYFPVLGGAKVKAVHRTVADSLCLLCATYGQKNDAIYGYLRKRQINRDFTLSLNFQLIPDQVGHDMVGI